MYLKQFDKKGNKYYVNAFNGVAVKIPTVNPLKREPNAELLQLMNPRFSTGYSSKSLENNQRSVFMGDFKKLMRTKPEERDMKEFIIACKHVNVNPWALFNVTYN